MWLVGIDYRRGCKLSRQVYGHEVRRLQVKRVQHVGDLFQSLAIVLLAGVPVLAVFSASWAWVRVRGLSMIFLLKVLI